MKIVAVNGTRTADLDKKQCLALFKKSRELESENNELKVVLFEG